MVFILILARYLNSPFQFLDKKIKCTSRVRKNRENALHYDNTEITLNRLHFLLEKDPEFLHNKYGNLSTLFLKMVPQITINQ